MTVRSELTPRVEAMAALLGVPMAYENVAFTKPANFGTFIEMFIVPAITLNATVDGTRQREHGLMQINIHTRQGVGTAQADSVLAAIKAAFPAVPKTGNVSIESVPSAKSALVSPDGYRVVPVVIPYRLEV